MDIVDSRVTTYLDTLYKPVTPELGELRADSEEKLIPIILKDTEGFLMNLLRMKRPAKILEIGTAVGYSACVMAHTLPECHITTIEAFEKPAETARENIKKLGYDTQIDVVVGPAQDVLDDLEPGYDFVFIDAAKSHYRTFWDKSVKLCNPGAIIISDNILMKGKTVLDRMDIIRRYRTSHKHMRNYLEYITNTDEADTALLPIGDGVAFSVLKGNNE